MNNYLEIYKTPEYEAKLMSIYDKHLKSWPVPYEELDIPTKYGTTHVIASGSKDAPPIFMIHAMGVNSTMWQPNVAELSKKFRIYAVDTIGDLGKSRLSDLSSYPKSGKEYSNWLSSLFDALEVKEAFMVGSSMGGWIAINHAIYAPDKIIKIALLGPMGLPSFMTTARVFVRIFSMSVKKGETSKERIIHWALGDSSNVLDFWSGHMGIAMKCRPKIGSPLKISASKLKLIKSPTLLFLGGKDGPIGNPKKIVKRARRCISDVNVEILPNAAHLMNVEAPELINKKIINYF